MTKDLIPINRTEHNEWYNLLRFFPELNLYLESEIGKHVPEEQTDLFHTIDSSGSEIEVLYFLHSLTLLYKPKLVLETGTHKGYCTLAIASGLAMNGLGKIVTVENDKTKFENALKSFKESGYGNHIELILADSLDYIKNLMPGTVFDIVFFDSRTRLRIPEFEALYEKGTLGNLAIFHDTTIYRGTMFPERAEIMKQYLSGLDRIAKECCTGRIIMPYSRGMQIMQVKKDF